MAREELVRLEEFEGELDEEWRGIRGAKVLDQAGKEVGTVEDAYVWARVPAVHLLRVSAGDGEDLLIPVDAVTGVSEDGVRVEQGRARILEGPRYKDEGIPGNEARRAAFEHYGYTDQLSLGG
ncbi:hypothetical protein Rxycam_02507 [Rubrobacter xylanophilus DSM 9941]|uniref:PRC-barrel domain-containing protein n=1 Tax=Rubrobacter xylanophilus TaxID=49319 RepID=UPI001C64407F|nr:PRC-barrel domain-containing protein [Rubrobacter xylanophilus]QYJ16672.1 hypothetical protein Rxycam_02507 [Rubrobacter xylanophilus DSM 9941]